MTYRLALVLDTQLLRVDEVKQLAVFLLLDTAEGVLHPRLGLHLKVERPDNWVNNDIPDIKLKTRLPEVPALMQDDSDVAKELPKPIFFRRRH